MPFAFRPVPLTLRSGPARSPLQPPVANGDPPGAEGAAVEHCAVLRHLAALQQHCSRIVRDQSREIDRLRAKAVLQVTALMWAQQDLALARQALPPAAAPAGLPSIRAGFDSAVPPPAPSAAPAAAEAASVAWERIGSNEGQGHTTATCGQVSAGEQAPTTAAPARPLAILWVGHPSAPQVVQRRLAGAEAATNHRMAPHGGIGSAADDPALFEASLAAADLVICQTGCLSHDAYWRVQDHCRRTGTRCVLIDNDAVAATICGV